MAPPTTLFSVYSMVDKNTKSQWIGGSYDNISAVTIAAALFQARMDYSPGSSLIAVFDSTDTAVAFIGHSD